MDGIVSSIRITGPRIRNGPLGNAIEHPVATVAGIWNSAEAMVHGAYNGYNDALRNGTLPGFIGAGLGHAAVFGGTVATDSEELEGVDAADAAAFGPRPSQSTLGADITYPDPVPARYNGDISPDPPVQDHNLAQALGGHPTDPENLDTRAWAENARKGAFEGQYLQDRTDLIAGGLTPEQADWVLEGQLRWIQTDIHASPVDPAILDRLPSP